jgi:hypothetical protein
MTRFRTRIRTWTCFLWWLCLLTSAINLRSAPSVVITDFPALGESKLVRGRVIDPSPGQYAVAVVIKVFGTYWTKPFANAPLSRVNAGDGSWSCNIFTGGSDACCEEILAYVVPANLQPVPLVAGSGSVPPELENAALAKTLVVRGSSTTIHFSGYQWLVKDTGECRWDPGANLWSRDLVSVDTNGWLHLQLAEIRGQYRCAEVSTQKPFGLGTFRTVLGSTVGTLAALDPAAVGGAFTFSPSAPATAYDELDPWEYSNGAVVGRARPFQFVVQPYQGAGRLLRYAIADTSVTTTHSVTWSRVPGTSNRYAMDFSTTDTETGRELARWHFEEERAAPPAPDLKFHLNLWANGTPQKPAEIIIKEFQWLPLPATIVPTLRTNGLQLVVKSDSPVITWTLQESADLVSWTPITELAVGQGNDATILRPISSPGRFFRVTVSDHSQ